MCHGIFNGFFSVWDDAIGITVFIKRCNFAADFERVFKIGIVGGENAEIRQGGAYGAELLPPQLRAAAYRSVYNDDARGILRAHAAQNRFRAGAVVCVIDDAADAAQPFNLFKPPGHGAALQQRRRLRKGNAEMLRRAQNRGGILLVESAGHGKRNADGGALFGKDKEIVCFVLHCDAAGGIGGEAVVKHRAAAGGRKFRIIGVVSVEHGEIAHGEQLLLAAFIVFKAWVLMLPDMVGGEIGINRRIKMQRVDAV